MNSSRSMLLSLTVLFFISTVVSIAGAQLQPATNPGAADGAPSSWQQIPIPPLPQWTAAQPKRIELANGMILFLQEDHELPLISGQATVRGGSRSEPASKVGMLEIYGDVWRTGGTGAVGGPPGRSSAPSPPPR